MPGSFTKDNRPVRPGAYFNWESAPTETIQPNIGSVVCLPIVHDWGPANVLTPCNSFSEFTTKFGPSVNTPGYAAVKQCFKGEGVSGRGGAGQVLVYRMMGSTAAAGSVTLLDSESNPAITLTALYPGSYSNNLGARVRVNSADPTRTEVQITLSGTTVETHAAPTGDLQAMADRINTASKWVSAEVVATNGGNGGNGNGNGNGE